MNKFWTLEQRMEAINLIAKKAFDDHNLNLVLVIKTLSDPTKFSAALINGDEQIVEVMKSIGLDWTLDFL